MNEQADCPLDLCGNWRAIPGFPGYFAHKSGTIYSGWYPTSKGRRFDFNHFHQLHSLPRKSDGYHKLTLTNADGNHEDVYVHQIVLLAFVGPCPENMESCHRDGNPSNNSFSNLRYDTRLNNAADRVQHGTGTRGITHNTTKLTEQQVLEIRQRICNGGGDSSISRDYNVSRAAIWSIRVGKSWGWINEQAR